MTKEYPKAMVLILIAILSLLYPMGALAQGKIWVDASGRPVSVSLSPQRIISIAPSITENLFALGLADRIVGVTDYCDFPPEALKKEKVGGGLNPSLEKIISLRPDLVLGLAGANNLRVVNALEKLRLPVYLLNSQGFVGVVNTIQDLGRLTGTEEKAVELVKGVKARAQAVSQLIKDRKRPKVLFVIWQEPLWTVGKDSFLNDLIEMAGGVSITRDIKGEATMLSPEAVIERAPEIILVSMAFGASRHQQPLKRLSKLSTVPAVKQGRVFILDSSPLNRASYRVAEGLEELARIFHPELFSSFGK